MYYTLMGLTLLSTPSSYLIVNCLYFSRWSFYYLKKNPYCCAFSVILWKEEPLKLPCLVSHYTCPNTLPTHTHTHKRELALSMHCLFQCQSVSCSRRCLLNSFLHAECTSLIPHFLTFLVPVTSHSRCPTALLTSGRRAQEMKETGVVGGEDEADGSRRSINSLSSWWLLWEGRKGWGERESQINDWIHLTVQESRFNV